MAFHNNTLHVCSRARATGWIWIQQRLHSGRIRSNSSTSNAYLRDMFSLEGRSCIVTGGGTGIGAALATGLAKAGASVVLTGRRRAVLEETVQRMKDETGVSNVHCVPCDITDFSQLDALIEDAKQLTGLPPTLLVNNAGINVRQKTSDLTADHWNTSLNLMLTAPFMLTRAMSEGMKEESYGRVVNIGSLQSYAAFPDSIPYAAAKSGTLGLTRALAEAYGSYRNVTCNAIAPGYVQTALTKSVFDDVQRSEQLAAATIVGRNSVPEDLVGATIFLCSPAASYVTGQMVPVDGGFTALGMR